MNNYIFKTTTTMKEYNNKKWWIDSDIVPEIRIKAETLRKPCWNIRRKFMKIHILKFLKTL